MSIFGEGLIERLHQDTVLQDPNNPMHKILDDGVGEWLDRFDDEYLGEMVFLESATGKWLDLHGREYGVPRRLDEGDDVYRRRIVYESLEHLTPEYLQNVYGLVLYQYVTAFDTKSNMLTSDNVFLVGERFMSFDTSNVRSVLSRKFPIDNIIFWLSNDGVVDFILGSGGADLLVDNMIIYDLENIYGFFVDDTGVVSVNLCLPNVTNSSSLFNGCTGLTSAVLNLPNSIECNKMFNGCTGLTSAVLNLPNTLDCDKMFNDCTGLTSAVLNLPNTLDCDKMFNGCTSLASVTLNMPKLDGYMDMFTNCNNLEYINITVPEELFGDIKDYIRGLNLQYLETLIINGEEVTP